MTLGKKKLIKKRVHDYKKRLTDTKRKVKVTVNLIKEIDVVTLVAGEINTVVE